VKLRASLHTMLNPSLFVQVAVLTLAGLGKFTLWGAVLVDVGTALVVILNGMTVLRWTRHPPSEAPRCAAERYAAQHGCVLRPRPRHLCQGSKPSPSAGR